MTTTRDPRSHFCAACGIKKTLLDMPYTKCATCHRNDVAIPPGGHPKYTHNNEASA